MMEVMSRNLMTYTLVCLILPQLHFIQTQDKTSFAEYEPDSSVNNRVRGISAENSMVTAGNSRCRSNHKCSTYGKEFYWCYTDDSGKWDYCCDGDCIKVGSIRKPIMECGTGTTYASCGGSGDRAADGTKCRSLHPCGTHGSKRPGYYWCYDDDNNEKECCNPYNETCIILSNYCYAKP
ncbi:hypothetical protein CHS0354_028539 [Potamilus streckersoni]|uniref:Uncharacterized protein n=1 Tax=Potamilus streckersoni TaxID=2493646 RepID=A0AAE0TJE9_9BIVA|nr:hypothetical protein CHS0354_028539 [Potamilus streckersoni]